MAIPTLTKEHADYHRMKIRALTSTSQRRWGEMDVVRMMRHLRAMIKLSLDDSEVKALVPPWIGKVVGWNFFDLFTTWPPAKKAKDPPAAFFREPELSFEEEQSALLEAVDRFVGRLETQPQEKRRHPVLGRISLARWARVHGVHMNHHYRQYGLVGRAAEAERLG